MKKAQGPWGLRPPGRPDTPSEGRAQEYSRVGPSVETPDTSSQRVRLYDNGTCLTFGPNDVVDEIDPAEQHPFFNQSLQVDRAIREIQVNRGRLESRSPMPLSRTHQELTRAQTTAAFPQDSYGDDSQALVHRNRHDNDNQAFNDFRTQEAPVAMTTSYRDSQGRVYQQVPSRYASVQVTPSVYGMPNRSDIAGEAHQGLTTDSRFGLQSRPPPNIQGSAQMPSRATVNRQNYRRGGHRHDRQSENPDNNSTRRGVGRATEHNEPGQSSNIQMERRRTTSARSRARGNAATRNFPDHDTPQQAAFAADLIKKGHIWEVTDDAGEATFETPRKTTFGRGNVENAHRHQQMNENGRQQGFGGNDNIAPRYGAQSGAARGGFAGPSNEHHGIRNPRPSFTHLPASAARGYDTIEPRHTPTNRSRSAVLAPPDAELNAAWGRHRDRTEPLTSLPLSQRSSNNGNLQSLHPRASFEPTTLGGLSGRRLFNTSRASSPGMTGSQRNDPSRQGPFTDQKK